MKPLLQAVTHNWARLSCWCDVMHLGEWLGRMPKAKLLQPHQKSCYSSTRHSHRYFTEPDTDLMEETLG